MTPGPLILCDAYLRAPFAQHQDFDSFQFGLTAPAMMGWMEDDEQPQINTQYMHYFATALSHW
jgi:hypothetical protein